MKFSIDIIWVSDDKQVVAVEQNIAPSTYPTSFCNDGQYVIELAAGTVSKLGLKQGDTVQL